MGFPNEILQVNVLCLSQEVIDTSHKGRLQLQNTYTALLQPPQYTRPSTFPRQQIPRYHDARKNDLQSFQVLLEFARLYFLLLGSVGESGLLHFESS